MFCLAHPAYNSESVESASEGNHVTAGDPSKSVINRRPLPPKGPKRWRARCSQSPNHRVSYQRLTIAIFRDSSIVYAEIAMLKHMTIESMLGVFRRQNVGDARSSKALAARARGATVSLSSSQPIMSPSLPIVASMLAWMSAIQNSREGVTAVGATLDLKSNMRSWRY